MGKETAIVVDDERPKINLFKIKEKCLPLGWCLYQKFEDVYYWPRQGGSY
jgi:hypothetical protein